MQATTKESSSLRGALFVGAGRPGLWPLRPLHFLLPALLLYAYTLKAAVPTTAQSSFPLPLSDYPAASNSLLRTLAERARQDPSNLAATILFFLAIAHTFLAPKFMRLSHKLALEHQQKLAQNGKTTARKRIQVEVSFSAQLFHFLGEVEAIFGIWVVPLMIVLTISKGWPTARDYVGHGVDFTEPLFVVVIMTVAASRPVLKFSEQILAVIAALGKSTTTSWWFTILTLGPLLGSFITEPASMTISALLLSERFYSRKPTSKLAYATLGLLFVNISIGGTLTHFAAPPVLMVSAKWTWNFTYMLRHFGWKALIGIVIANLTYLVIFRRELKQLNEIRTTSADLLREAVAAEPVPAWVTIVHILFLVWTVMTSHYPALFIGGFLFYLAFLQATEHHQSELTLRPALLVGFFLAGLVVHGGLQGWWIGPVLSGLKETPLFIVAGILTAFNDNAAITYLATLVPDLNESLKYAVVAGAVTGGGLTVIANAPNPAGQAILAKFFPEGIAPLGLLIGALIPTLLVGLAFLFL